MKIGAEFFQNTKDAPADGWISLPAATVRRALHRVLPAVSKDETRAHVNSVLFECDGKMLRAVATDGHRAHVARETVDAAPFKTLLRRLAARVLDAALEGRAVDFAIHEAGLFVRLNGDAFKVETVSAQYPPYESVMPKAAALSATFDRLSLRQAIILAARVDPRGYERCNVRIRVGPDRSVKVTLTQDSLPFSVECPAAVEAATEMTIAARAAYLITALRTVGGERVCAYRENVDPVTPIALVPAGEPFGAESLTAVVMPVRE